MMYRLLLTLWLFATLNASAVNFYVDNTAAGSNNGTSWANAWTSFASINWSGINAGDTLYISGGTTTKTYSGTLSVGASGSVGNPINIRPGQDAGHNGIAILDGSFIDLTSGATRNYINIDGSYGGVNHFAFVNFFSPSDATHDNGVNASKVYAPNTTGCSFSYINFTNVNNCLRLDSANDFYIGHIYAIDVRGDAFVRAPTCNASGTQTYDRSIVEYCTVYLSRNDGSGPAYGGVYPMIGPDGVQGSYCLTIRYNFFTVRNVSYNTSYQHPDYTQTIGNYVKIYGNTFQDIGDSANDFDGWINPNMSHIWIYNNLYRIVNDRDPFPEYIRVYSGSANMLSYTDWHIVNNTFLDNGWNNIRLIWKGTPTVGMEIVNNIFVNTSPYEIASNWSGSLTFSNNVYYPSTTGISYNCAPAGGVTSCNNYTASSWSAIEPSRILGLPTFASYTYRAAGNDLHLASSDTVARNAALNFSAYFSTDHDGNPRFAPWDVGAYEYQVSSAGQLSLSASSYMVNETDGGLSVTLRRTAGSSGAITVDYATANGTALGFANYTPTSGTKSWSDGDTADKTVTIPILNAGFSGTKDFSFSLSNPTGGATLGGPNSATISITGSSSCTPLAGTNWLATNGVVSVPYYATNDYVVSYASYGDPAVGGYLGVCFTNSSASTNTVKVEVDAPGDANNSFYINFDTNPTEPPNVMDVLAPYTSGFEYRYASWRGAGSFDAPQYRLKTWALTPGAHTLIIRSREAGTKIRRLIFTPPPPDRPTNSVPANGALEVSRTPVLTSSAYICQNNAAQTHAQFQVYLSDGTTLVWDSGTLSAVITDTVPSGYLNLGGTYKWRSRHENAVGVSDWSDLTSFTTTVGAAVHINSFGTKTTTVLQ